MAKQPHATPLLDQLESGPWPSFVTGLKRLAKDNDMMVDLMGQLETSYKTRFGYWKGGTVGVVGYGGGVIPRFTELKDANHQPLFPESAEFHTLRIQPPAGMHYTSDLLRQFCDAWLETGGSGLIALHGQSGDIMLQGIKTADVQRSFDKFNEMGFDLGGAGPALRKKIRLLDSILHRADLFLERVAGVLGLSQFHTGLSKTSLRLLKLGYEIAPLTGHHPHVLALELLERILRSD